MCKSLRTSGFVVCWAVGLCAVAQPAAVQRALDAQSAAWNRGDAAAFMAEGYWESPNLVFVGSKGLTEGYEPTLQRYLTSYPNAQAMGHLVFGTLRWERLGLRHGLLVGTWKLDRTGEHATVSGHFSLVWRRTWKGWRIIADHSS
jgi:ketosteroid isomerase-like protein